MYPCLPPRAPNPPPRAPSPSPRAPHPPPRAPQALLATKEYATEPQRSWVLPLHSSLPPSEQKRVFDRPPPGVRKVVLTTNIAETAITVDDVAYVIDTGRMKEKRFDPARRMESLEDVLVSRANAKQRRGE